MSNRLGVAFSKLKPGHLILLILGVELAVSLVVIPLLAPIDRVLYSIGFVDQYDELALTISQGFGYRFHPYTAPTLMREPGYPLLLAGLFWMFGYGLVAIRLVNLMLAGVAAWIQSSLVSKVTANNTTALVAVLLFLLNPGVVMSELRGGVEIPFIALELAFVASLSWAVRSNSLKRYFVAGLVLGLASTVRSTALLFPVLLPIYFFFLETPRPRVTAMCLRLILIAVGATLVLSPWMIRNYRLVGVPTPSASVGGIAEDVGLYMCKNISVENDLADMDWKSSEVRADLARAHGYKFSKEYYMYFYDTRDELTFNKLLQQRVLREYLQNPLLLPRCAAINSLLFWFGGKTWVSSLYNVVLQLPYIVGSIIGTVLIARRGRLGSIALSLLFCAYTMLVYILIHAQARYSVQIVPFLAIFMAAGLIPGSKSRDGQVAI